MGSLEKNGSAVENIDGIVMAEKMDAEKGGDRENDRTFGVEKDKSLWFKFKAPVVGEIRFNPVVSTAAILIIWIFVGICANFQEEVPFKVWRGWIVDNFTWLYIGVVDVFAVFAVVLYFSKYSDLKLGKEDDKPEFSDPTWFMMLFACGIGTGLFFFGVAEPLFHYTGGNRYSADPTRPDNKLAQDAMNLTLYHWGIHGWIVYSLVGLLLSMMAFREGLPMTMKSCFYPLIGDRVFGWMGDLIDVTSIITTLFGVCTSLGLGTRQLNAGLHILNSDIPSDDVTVQVIIIWCITAVATISVVTGVGVGIRRLSETCFLVGMFLMLVALFSDNTFYILNLYVQSIGYYFQNILQLGFHTDAFEQLGPASGFEDRGRWVPPSPEGEGPATADGPQNWMDSWTMFYWGWWISWCPFVGMFIAKISKGRTIKQFINGTLTAPIIYTFLWLVIFGGAGIRQERMAANAGLCCADQKGWFLNSTALNDTVNSRVDPTDTLVPESSYWMCQDDGKCGTCAVSVLNAKGNMSMTYGDFISEYISQGSDFGSILADRSVSRLSCHSTEQMWFDVMRSYSGIGEFLSMFSLIGIVLYFVTSSDSGSLVIDCLSANGDPDPPTIQRVFWALTEGATATALLVAGGKEGLVALQTAGILSGLPFTFLVCLICVAIWRACKVAAGDFDPRGPTFAISLFDPLGTAPYSEISGKTTGKLFLQFAANIFIAPYTVAIVGARLNNSKKIWAFCIPAFGFFGLFILCHILEAAVTGMWAIAWFFFLGFVTMMTAYRIEIRERYGINGNAAEDFFASCFYPACALQMDLTTQDLESDSEKSNGKIENFDLEKTGGDGIAKAAGPGAENMAYIDSEKL